MWWKTWWGFPWFPYYLPNILHRTWQKPPGESCPQAQMQKKHPKIPFSLAKNQENGGLIKENLFGNVYPTPDRPQQQSPALLYPSRRSWSANLTIPSSNGTWPFWWCLLVLEPRIEQATNLPQWGQIPHHPQPLPCWQSDISGAEKGANALSPFPGCQQVLGGELSLHLHLSVMRLNEMLSSRAGQCSTSHPTPMGLRFLDHFTKVWDKMIPSVSPKKNLKWRRNFAALLFGWEQEG